MSAALEDKTVTNKFKRLPKPKPAPSRNRKSILRTVLASFIVCLVAVFCYVLLHDLSGPDVQLKPDSGRASMDQTLHLSITDSSGLKSVKAIIRYSGEPVTVLDKSFPNTPNEQNVEFSLAPAKLKDGSFDLEITARDASWSGFGFGNSTTIKRKLTIDSQPPRIYVRSTAPNLHRGSVTAIAFSLSEDVVKTGIQVGDIFFPAFLQKNGLYVCFIAYPIHLTEETFLPEIIAEDGAGNVGRYRPTIHLIKRNFRNDKLNISDGFINRKAQDFEEILPGGDLTPLERYIKINNEVRLQNEAVLRGLAAKTAPEMLWSGAFLRLPRSAARAAFGDSRDYIYQNQIIDHQTHMGIDLASVANAPVPAANSGIVVYAGPLGIYGNLVVIDHGLGLMSLYSHLSHIQVKVGDHKHTGDVIGNTGATGLAGGDHLHFGILLNGYQVQPIDWLDSKWIQNTILNRIQAAAGQPAASIPQAKVSIPPTRSQNTQRQPAKLQQLAKRPNPGKRN